MVRAEWLLIVGVMKFGEGRKPPINCPSKLSGEESPQMPIPFEEIPLSQYSTMSDTIMQVYNHPNLENSEGGIANVQDFDRERDACPSSSTFNIHTGAG